MSFIKNLFRDNWRILARMGFDFVSKHLHSRIRLSNPFFASIMEKIFQMGDDAIDVLTDNDKNDAAQLKALVEENYEELIALVAAGSVTQLPSEAARLRVIAILEDTCDKLKGDIQLKKELHTASTLIRKD